MFYATSNAFSDEIISKYIYGNGGKPDDLTSASIITRQSGADAEISVTDYMAGPGRFASPAFFKLIRDFFTLTNSEMMQLIDGYGPDQVIPIDGEVLPNNQIDFDEFGNAYIPKNALIYMLGIYSAGLDFHQALFNDGADDYFQRSFIWASSSFKISDGAIFRIDADGGNRRIENFSIIPRGAGDNFDFEGGELSNFLRPIAEPLLDPFHLGSTVNISFMGSIAPRTYGLQDYNADYAARPFSVGGIDYAARPIPAGRPDSLGEAADYSAAVAALGANSIPYFQRIHGNGVVQYYQGGYHLFYGTSEADTLDGFGLNPLINYPHVNFYPGQPNGVRVVAGSGNDTVSGDIQFNNYLEGGTGDDVLTGGALADILDGGADADELDGGFGDDTLIIDSEDTVISGGVGYDTADLRNFTASVQWIDIVGETTFGNSNAELSALIGAQVSGIDKIVGTSFDDLFTLKTNDNPLNPDGNLDIDGGDGNDQIIGNDSANTFWGGKGNDFLDGGSDDDILRGGDNDDIIVGGADDYTIRSDEDTIYGGAGDDRILGGFDVDTIFGEGDNDIVLGGQGDDEIDGGTGNDILIGGEDSDTIKGGTGNDIIDGWQNDSAGSRGGMTEDQLYGGANADIFLTTDGDTIHDLDGSDIRVKFEEKQLTGGTRSSDDAKGVYKADDGTTYRLANNGTLTVTRDARDLTILNFRNGYARIDLREESDKPDPDRAERNRDPLIIDLDGNRKVIAADGQRSVYFDFNTDGFAEHTAWVRPGDALLAIDRNSDGVINNASELFGTGYVRTQGQLPLKSGTDGFADLAQYDLNGDKLIDSGDPVFSDLRLWVDANSDGITDNGELKTLAQLGLVSISLRTRSSDHLDNLSNGTSIDFMSSALKADGSVLGVYDVFLSVDTYDTRNTSTTEVGASIAALPFVIGSGTVQSLHEAMADDPALQEMVRAFANLQIADADQIADKIEQILFRWTGADQVSEYGRGPNMNGRQLHVVEQLSGRPFYQAPVGPNPRSDAAQLLVGDYSNLLAGFASKLLTQTVLGQQLLPGLSFKAGALFWVDDGASLETLLPAAAAGAPEGKQAALRYWAAIVDVIDTYGARAGLNNSNFPSLLNPILVASGLPLTTQQLRSTTLATDGGNLTISSFGSKEYILADGDPAKLRGTHSQTTYVIGRVDGLVLIEPVYLAGSQNQQSLILTEHSRDDFLVEVEFDGGGETLQSSLRLRLTSQIDNTVIQLPATLNQYGLISAIDRITFAGEATSSTFKLTDLLAGGIENPNGDGKIYFGLSSGQSVIEGLAGNDVLLGFAGADEYRFGPGGGHDTIVDRGQGSLSSDTLVLAGIRADYRFEQAGPRQEDLLIVHIASGDTVNVGAQFSKNAQEVETFRFGDGEELTADALALEFTTGTFGIDPLIGTFRDDFIDGRGGADILDGRAGADRYYFELGSGGATIIDTGTDNIIRFGGGIAAEDLRLIRGDRDVAITYGAGDIINLRRSTVGSESPVVLIEFDDGSSISFAELVERAIEDTGTVIDGQLFGTPGADQLTGSVGNDLIDGLGGNDSVNGGGGNDTFVFREGRLSISDGAFTSDTLFIPKEYSIDDFILEISNFSYPSGRLRVRFNGSSGVAILPNGFTSAGDRDSSTADDVERIVFEDGLTINLALGSVETGTAGDDVLMGWRDRFHPQGATVFKPGAGNDYIFAGAWNQTLELNAGFGSDVFFADYQSTVSFTNISLNANTIFDRVGDDLRISFANSTDTLTVKRAFGYQNDLDTLTLRFGSQTLSFQQIIDRTSIATGGDDLLFGTAILDGGSGNDTLVGDYNSNTYIFGRGYGNDVVKEQDFLDGNNNGYVDTLNLVGLNRNDIAFARDATDPLSIIITIKDTGETLKLDGSPFDDIRSFNEFLGDGQYESDVAGAHWIDVIQFADGGTMSQAELAQAVLDAEATEGGDTLVAFGSPLSYFGDAPILDGGQGDDIYQNSFRNVHVRLSADGGVDRLETKTTTKAAASYDQSYTYVHLDVDLNPSDILVLFEQREGHPVTILRTKAGSELFVEDRLIDGERSKLYIIAADGTQFSPTEDGGLVDQLVGTQDVDYLLGALDLVFDGESYFGEGAFDEVFTPGEGDDFIAGRGGNDVVVFNRGDGSDILLGDQGPRNNGGVNAGRFRDPDSGSYAIEFGDDISAEDIEILWLDGLNDLVTVGIKGTNDRITAKAETLTQLRFQDGSSISFDGPQTTFVVDPGNAVPSLSSLNETIIATGGSVTVQLNAEAGRDLFIDRFFDDQTAAGQNLGNWQANAVQLEGGSSLDDFAFIKDTNNPSNLVVRNSVTGAELIIQNQFARVTAAQDAWTDVPLDGAGAPSWLDVDVNEDGTSDLAYLDVDSDGVLNWPTLDITGDGQSDWQAYREGTISLGENESTTIYAYDGENDGVFEFFDVYRQSPFGPDQDFLLTLRDVDFDGTPDEYSSDYDNWLSVPTFGDGSLDWAAIDVDADGFSDLSILDPNSDGIQNWQTPDFDISGLSWNAKTTADLIGTQGYSLGSRYTLEGQSGTFFSFFGGEGAGGNVVGWDIDGDLTPDRFGFDTNYDGFADVAVQQVVVQQFQLLIQNGPDTEYIYFDWTDIEGRVVNQAVEPLPVSPYFDLASITPGPTVGDDRLRIVNGSLDSLAGNDVIIASGNYATLHYGRGDGDDVFANERQAPDTPNGEETYSLASVVLDDIYQLSELSFSRGGDDLNDLIVTIKDTGESLTIRDQLRTGSFGSAAPAVVSFQLAGGEIVYWDSILPRIDGTSNIDDNNLSTGDDGGLIDGGAGFDQLNGGSGDDVYRFGRGFDEDVIRDAGGFDAVQFDEGIAATDLFFSRTGTDGSDLLVEISGEQRLALTIKGQFAADSARVERFELSDGSIISWSDIQQFILLNAGTGSDDAISGFDSNDRINSDAGNDIIQGGRGNDIIDGGAGRDAATYRGAASEYEYTTVNGVTTVRDLVVGRDGTDTLSNIEDLQFLGDGSTVSLLAPNQVPIAAAYSTSTDEDNDVVIARAALLALASDPDNNLLALRFVTNGINGKAWIDIEGNVRYRPNLDFNGTDHFSYSVSDGNGGVATARIDVAIASRNDAPVVSYALEEQRSPEDQPVSFIVPSEMFRDIDGDALGITATLSNGDPLPEWLSFADGRMTGSPPANFNGIVNISVIASDGTASVSSNFALNILPRNDAPTVVGQIADLAVVPGAPVLIQISAALFEDVDGDAITVSVVMADGESLPAWLTFDGQYLNGTVPANFAGTLALNVNGSDGKASAIESFSLSANSNNQPVVVNPLQSISVNEDQSIDFTIPANTFADADGDVLSFAASQANGSPVPSWLSFVDGRFTGTPPADFNGSISLVVTASDGLATASSAFDLVILPLNDAPIAQNDNGFATDEDTPLEIATAALVANDGDVDVDALTVVSVASAIGGTVTLVNGQIQFTPDANFYGDASFSYSVSDPDGASDTALASITVLPVNDAPIVMTEIADLVSIEDQAVSFALATDAFVDVDGDVLSLTAMLANGDPLPNWLSFDGQSFSGNPPLNFNGVLTIAVIASDGIATAAQQFSLTIAAQNDAPIIAQALADQISPEDQAILISLPQSAFADVDGDTLTLSATLAGGNDLPAWLTFTNGQFTGTPPANFAGVFDITVIASDGALTVSDVFRLTIESVNDAPVVALALADVSVPEDTAISISLPAGTFADIEGDALTLSAALANESGALPTWLTFAGGQFTGTPPANFNGSLDIEVVASDGSLSVSDIYRLDITAVNDAPLVSIALVDRSSAEDVAIDFTLPLGSFTDVDNASLTYSAQIAGGAALPSWLSFDAAASRFTGTPPLNFNGFVDVEVTASDGSLSTSDIFRLSVNAVNDAPTVSVALLDRTTPEDSAIDFTVPAGSFADVDNEALTLTATLVSGASLPGWLSFDAGTARFTGTPPANFNGFIDVRVTASDGALSVADEFRLTVTPVNDAPVAVNDGGLSVIAGTALVVQPTTLLANDNDPDGNAPSIISVGSAVGGTVSLNGQGQVVYTPDAAYQGTGSFSYIISDGSLTATATASVQVTAAGSPWVYGTSGNDNLYGQTNAVNWIDGLAGDDTIVGGSLNDQLVGGAGNDNLYAGAGNDTLTGGDGNDTVTGEAGDDIIMGGSGADLLYAGLGNDTVDAGDGNDTVTGDDGNDIIAGGEGVDLLYGGAGNDNVDGGGGNDTLTGDAGTDILVGGLGDDTIYGGDGTDTLTGGDGADKLYGDALNDILSGGAGNDIIDGGSGIDTADYSSATAALTINLATNSGISGTETDTIYNMENVIGGSGNDVITGSTAANTLSGGDGNDTLSGGNGNDTLNGGAGNDTLTGGTGNDAIIGGAGTDKLILAGLQASYTITTANGTVSIVDNQPTVDGNDGTDTISGIEQLQFKGGTTVNITSPIILDLDGNGVKTLSAADSNARYDLDGDGLADDTSWFGSTEGMLFLDRDGNGKVTNAGEFSFIDDVVGAKSDLEGLRAFDSNKDGILSAADTRFAAFRVWQDRDGDGAAEDGEILSLTTAGVRSIKLTGTAVNATTQLGEVAVINKGSYTRTNGATMEFLDAALTYFSSANNLPSVAVRAQSFDRKDSKYRVSFAGGVMTVAPTGKQKQVDPRAGTLAASNLMTFKGKSIGLLSPIILDLDGDGIEMRSIKKSKAAFDMNGDGIADDTGWTGKGDGFLVIDRNNDGKITHASELSFAAENKDAKSDLEALASLDNNGDRVIDAKDVRFAELKVWVDANGNGVTDAGELKTLEEVGITSISLAARNLEGTAKVGDNVLISTSTFTRSNGSTGTVGNTALAYKPGKVSAAIDGTRGGDGGRFGMPERLVSEYPDISPSDNLDAADAGLQGNSFTATEQAAAILRGAKSGGGLTVPQIGMFENGRDIVNIFDYYEQPDQLTTASTTIGKETTSLRLADLIDAPSYSQDMPTSVQSVGIEDALLTGQSSADPSTRLLALIAQDMAAFGARIGENDLSWRRDSAKPVEFFA